MLGEKIAEIKATAVTKILPANGSKPRFETATEGAGGLGCRSHRHDDVLV